MYSGGCDQVRRVSKIFSGVWGTRTTSPHTFTGKTRLYTQHFAATRMSGKIRVSAPERLKVGKIGYFSHFFANITAELLILQ